MPDLLVLIPLGVASGYFGSLLQSWLLRRRTYALECDVADLQDGLLRELKKRAGLVNKSKLEEELLNRVHETPQAAKEDPWWMQYVQNRADKAS